MLGAVLFSIGAVGVFTQRNALIIYMCIELMLNAVNLTFIAFSRFLNNMDGHVFVFMIMTVAAAEAAVGLAIIISLFRNKATVNVDDINLSKG
jgi:NADH-quinone oxidoreductase subunit K